MWYESAWTFIPLNVDTFIVALNLVAALLISFGGLIGKVSPLQLVIMTLLETVFYSINKSIFLVGALQFIDGKAALFRCVLLSTALRWLTSSELLQRHPHLATIR